MFLLTTVGQFGKNDAPHILYAMHMNAYRTSPLPALVKLVGWLNKYYTLKSISALTKKQVLRINTSVRGSGDLQYCYHRSPNPSIQ